VSDVQEHNVPPAGEEIHLPGPTVIPLLNALGITGIVIGLTTGWIVLVAGAVLFLATTVRWIADTRRDISELPLEH
jgi:multisubunit Na+/H+ antiporter MnhC subunit